MLIVEAFKYAENTKKSFLNLLFKSITQGEVSGHL